MFKLFEKLNKLKNNIKNTARNNYYKCNIKVADIDERTYNSIKRDLYKNRHIKISNLLMAIYDNKINMPSDRKLMEIRTDIINKKKQIYDYIYVNGTTLSLLLIPEKYFENKIIDYMTNGIFINRIRQVDVVNLIKSYYDYRKITHISGISYGDVIGSIFEEDDNERKLYAIRITGYVGKKDKPIVVFPKDYPIDYEIFFGRNTIKFDKDKIGFKLNIIENDIEYDTKLKNAISKANMILPKYLDEYVAEIHIIDKLNEIAEEIG